MKICLGIDASAQESSIAIAVDGTLQAEETSATGPSGEVLLVLLQRALQTASLSPSSIHEVAVGIGPGSFTGIRNGIATAQGFASPGNLPVIGMSGLLALAEPQEAEYSLIAYTANQQEFFAAYFSAGNRPAGEVGVGEPDIVIESGALTISKRELSFDESTEQASPTTSSANRELLRAAELFSDDRRDWPLSMSVFTEEPLRFQPSLAARMACFPHQRLQIGSRSFGRVDEKQSLFQLTKAGRGLVPVYAKPVNAKTLIERGLSV